MLREPVLMVTSLLRSMDFVSNQRVIQMEYLQNKIGQMAHNFQSVFSFFLPEFKPYGLVGEALLVSPEATILDTPNIIGILNGAISLVKYGLSHLAGGFARDYEQQNDSESSLGFLEFNRTVPKTEFSFETFEGPSLSGGFDNYWGKSYKRSGRAVPDPHPKSKGKSCAKFLGVRYYRRYDQSPIHQECQFKVLRN